MGSVVAKLAFLPPPPTYDANWSALQWLTTSRGQKIPFVYIPFPGTRLTILFSHANAEDLGLIYEHLLMLANSLQVNVMGYDYTGYGHATGTASELDCYADIAACLAYLMKDRDLLPEEVILFGRSLGGGPSVDLASKAHVGGVILQSTFTSCIRVAYDAKHTAFDAFCNIQKIHKIRAPVLIIHGTKDDVVPEAHGRALFKSCRYPHRPFWVEGACHNDIEIGWGAELRSKLADFVYAVEDKIKAGRSPLSSSSQSSSRASSASTSPRTVSSFSNIPPSFPSPVASPVDRPQKSVYQPATAIIRQPTTSSGNIIWL